MAYYATSAPASLAAFFARADVILVSLPSTPETRHIVDARALGHMKRDAVLVNIGRGDLVDTDALVQALDEGAFSLQ